MKVRNREDASVSERQFAILSVEEPAANTVCRPGSPILGKGWVLATEDVADIRIYLGDRFAGHATYGAFRPDIAQRFPSHAQADQSGFSFAVTPAALGDEPIEDLTVVVRTTGGHDTRRVVPLQVAGQGGGRNVSTGEPGLSDGSAGLWPVRLFLDDARIDERGLLRARGWVLSMTPVLELRLFLGTTALDTPDQGLPRPDIALLHPGYPGAAASGFKLVQELTREDHSGVVLRVLAVCQGGQRRQIVVPVERRCGRRPAAVVTSAGQVCCDLLSLNTEGALCVSGWAIAEPGVSGIVVELDGAEVGQATIGLARPDVGNMFPRVASARQSGFSFTSRVPAPLPGEHLLTLRVRENGGDERLIPLPVEAVSPDQERAAADGHAPGGILHDLDRPALSGDRVREPIRTALAVRGWAISMSGIGRVEVLLDGRNAGHAYYGLRREDVAAAFPDYPDSLLCGFGLQIPARMMDDGEHCVRIVIHTRNGETAERSFYVVCERSGAVEPWETIRPRIGHVEITQGLAILDRQGHSRFAVHVSVPDVSAESLAAARATLDSLAGQAYPDWRAVLTSPHLVEVGTGLARLAASHQWLGGRISVGTSVEREHADDAGFVCLLRAGDVLGRDALLEFAIHAALNPDDDFIYSDDRRRIFRGGPAGPFFKPDWSPELLMAFNYIGRAWCVRASALPFAGIDPATLGALGDYAVVLRLTEAARSIGHIPKLLLDASAVAVADAAQIDRQALADAVARADVAAAVVPGRAGGTFRVRREAIGNGRVSVVMPTVAARGLIEKAVDGLRRNTGWPDIEIVCIDNIPGGADDAWKGWIRENADAVIELREPFNWSRFNNAGAAAASGEYLLFLNDDIEMIEPDWLGVLLGHAQRPDIGVVGPRLLYPDGKVQHGGMFLTRHGGQHAFRFAGRNEPGPFGLAQCERNVIAVTGACMLTRRDVFDAVGGFNEAHGVVNNDVDFCLRVRRAGYRVVFTPYATLTHHELASRAKLADSYDERQFRDDWGSLLVTGDPYFNPSLSQDSDHYVPEPEPAEIVYAGHPLMAADDVRRILAVKIDHLGDFVTALPALRRLSQRFPGAELHVLAPAGSMAIAELESCIDTVHEFNFFHVRSGDGQRAVTEADLGALRERMRKLRFDIAVDLRMQPDTRHVLQCTGAGLLAGFDHNGRFPWLDIALQWEGDEQMVAKRAHVSDRLTQLAEAVAVACEIRRPALACTPVAAARACVAERAGTGLMPADFFAGPVVCVHPGVGSEMRQWPADHFAALIDLLIEDGARIMLIGAGDEEKIALSVLEKVRRPDGVLSLVGRTSLRDLPHVLRAATLYVGNNSGPKHLAATLGVPTLGIHSAVVDATEWGPVGPDAAAIRRKVQCGPCYLGLASQCSRKLECLTGLLPGDVYRMCRRMLGGLANPARIRPKTGVQPVFIR